MADTTTEYLVIGLGGPASEQQAALNEIGKVPGWHLKSVIRAEHSGAYAYAYLEREKSWPAEVRGFDYDD